MCYPNPGPRCSYHAHKEWVEAAYKYEQATTEAEKLRTKTILDEKRAAYELTPRGQNDLLQSLTNLNSETEKKSILLKIEALKAKRKSMIAQYYANRNGKDVEGEKVNSNINLPKYQKATAYLCAVLSLKYETGEHTVEILDDKTLLVDEVNKILVIPERFFKTTIGVLRKDTERPNFFETGYSGDDLATILNKNFGLAPQFADGGEELFSWWVKSLQENGYTSVGFSNVQEEYSRVIGLDDFHKIVETIKVKTVPRIPGTVKTFHKKEHIQSLLSANPLFSQGTLIELPDAKITVLTGVEHYAHRECVLNEEFFLAWRESKQLGGYYEVRRKPSVKSYDISLKLSIDDSRIHLLKQVM